MRSYIDAEMGAWKGRERERKSGRYTDGLTEGWKDRLIDRQLDG